MSRSSSIPGACPSGAGVPGRSRRGGPALAALARGLAVTTPIALSPAAAAPATAAPFTTGYNDAYLAGLPERTAWLARMRADGAHEIRVNAAWSVAAPVRPPDEASAEDPAWPGYRFGPLDGSLRLAAAAGLRPMLTGFSAPGWAQAAGRPADARPGTWKPDPVAFGRFMRALAARYDGTFPDPEAPGRTLPRVDAFQVWNEPNLATYLAPQWSGRRSASPARYRALLNAGYAGVKGERPDATVVSAGNSPFGDARVGSSRMPPARFWREVLCLDRTLRRTCRSSTRMDVIAHHPYPTGGPPSQRTRSPDDVSIADVSKLTRITAAARRRGTLGPRGPALWVTEFGIRSNPPHAAGGTTLGLPEQARYMAESTWRLWAQGVRRLYLFSIVDIAPRDGSTILSGLGVHLQDGTPKPSATAMAFTTYARTAGGRLRIWVRPPAAGAMRVQARRAGTWRTVATVAARTAEPVTVSTAPRGVTAVRALLGPRTSYVWSVRR